MRRFHLVICKFNVIPTEMPTGFSEIKTCGFSNSYGKTNKEDEENSEKEEQWGRTSITFRY